MVRIVAIGDNDVDCYLSTGEMYPGGNCFNVAVLASRFGAQSAFVGAIGQDAAGALMRNTLLAENVATERLRIEDGMTAYCVIGHRNADRVFLTYDLGVSRFEPNAGDIEYLGQFDAAHIGQSSGLDQWIPDFSAKTRISYDFSNKLDDGHIARMARHCWLATASGGDLDEQGGLALLAKIQAAGAHWVLVTRGSDGALLGHQGALFRIAAVPVDTVDTLGAGDTIITRLLVGLLRQEDPQSALEAAVAAAAQTCSYYGAIGHGAPINISVPLPQMTEC